MKTKITSIIMAITLLVLCALTLTSCDKNGEELAGTVADLPQKTNDSYYLKIDGIEGESIDSSHAKWINVLSFSMGADNSELAGRGTFKPFTFTHKIDAATPRIQNHVMSGRHILQAEFHVCRPLGGKQEVVYKVIFNDFVIVKAEIGLANDGTNVETVTCIAKKITWQAAKFLSGSIYSTTDDMYEMNIIPDYSESSEEAIPEIALPADTSGNSYFVCLDGISGESTDSNHNQWINALDYNMGSLNSIQNGSLGNSSFKAFTFTHLVDSTTPKIQKNCMSQMIIGNVKLHVCKNIAGKQTVIYSATLENSRISNADIGISSDGKLLETVSLIPTKVTWETTIVNADSSIGGKVQNSYEVK